MGDLSSKVTTCDGLWRQGLQVELGSAPWTPCRDITHGEVQHLSTGFSEVTFSS
jgi:hypothetical protein